MNRGTAKTYQGNRMLMAENQRRLIIDHIPEGGLLLEWGGGGSSLWFADHLAEDARLFTIEHHPKWSAKLRQDASERDNWEVISVPGIAGENAQPDEENPALMEGYILAAYECCPVAPDIILVDGVARGACLVVASTLFPEAHLFLHDVNRPWYGWAQRLLAISGRKESVIHPDPGDYPCDLSHFSPKQ